MTLGTFNWTFTRLGCKAKSDIYALSDDTENIATIPAAVYSGVPSVDTGFHIPSEELPKTVRESER